MGTNDDNKDLTSKGVKQEVEHVTIEMMSDAVEEAKEIMRFFIRDHFDEDTLNRAEGFMSNTSVHIDESERYQDFAAYYDFGSCSMYLVEHFCKEKMNDIDMMHTIIHEFSHAFSYLSNYEMMNSIIEEAIANVFAEMCINYYIYKGNKINCISDQDNEKIAQNKGYFDHLSYIKEGDFTRNILYALSVKGKDMEAIQHYLFRHNIKFFDICEEVLGSDLKEILLGELSEAQISVEGNDSNLYLPKATDELKLILYDFYTFPLDESITKKNVDIESGRFYSVGGDIIKDVYYINKLRFDWLDKIDFSKVTEDNMYDIFSQLKVEDIQMATEKSNGEIQRICLDSGYNNFIKLLINGWYEVNKDNSENFDEILSLTGSIPYDLFNQILKDKKVDNIRDVLYLAKKYNMFSNEINEYISLMDLLRKQIDIDYSASERGSTFYTIDNIRLDSLLNLDLSDEDFKKILYLYATPLDDIDWVNIWNVADVLEKIDPSTIKENEQEIYSDIESYLTMWIGLIGEGRDLGILMKLQKMPEYFGENVIDKLVYEPEKVFKEVRDAIQAVSKRGYEIENESEILECVQNCNYKDIKFVPGLSVKALRAFEGNFNATGVLLNACINQFLEDENPEFFNDPENFNTCLELLDEGYQNALELENNEILRYCSILKDKINNSGEIKDEYRKKLLEKIDINLSRNGMAEDSRVLIDSAISATIEQTTSSQIFSQSANMYDKQNEQYISK